MLIIKDKIVSFWNGLSPTIRAVLFMIGILFTGCAGIVLIIFAMYGIGSVAPCIADVCRSGTHFIYVNGLLYTLGIVMVLTMVGVMYYGLSRFYQCALNYVSGPRNLQS